MLRAAATGGMWIAAPPPSARELANHKKISNRFDPVLAWDLGSGLATSEKEATKVWARLVRGADPRNRPLLCDADSDLKDYSPAVDLLVAHAVPLGTTLPLADYATLPRALSRPSL